MSMSRSRGFSLIEVLVAFALLAGGLGLLIAILSGGMNQVRWAQTHSEAVQVARTALDTLGTIDPLQPGRFSGEAVEGRYQWDLLVEPWDEAPPGAPAPFDQVEDAVAAFEVYRVELELRWDGGGPRERLRMSTLRSVSVDAGAAGIEPAGARP
jgi:general secretion pathway protein I